MRTLYMLDLTAFVLVQATVITAAEPPSERTAFFCHLEPKAGVNDTSGLASEKWNFGLLLARTAEQAKDDDPIVTGDKFNLLEGQSITRFIRSTDGFSFTTGRLSDGAFLLTLTASNKGNWYDAALGKEDSKYLGACFPLRSSSAASDFRQSFLNGQ